jgi:hypothetical protein
VIDAGDYRGVSRFQWVRAVVQDQFHRTREHQIEIDGVGVMHGKRDTGPVIDHLPVDRTGRNTQIQDVGGTPPSLIEGESDWYRTEYKIPSKPGNPSSVTAPP